MKLAFALPHTIELPAITARWERDVTGPQQAAIGQDLIDFARNEKR